MKVFLDDVREAPDGWIHVLWPEQVIDLLKTGQVTDLSLDHDLGNDGRGTGYDVLIWIEDAVVTSGFVPPQITIHSANSAAVKRMEAALQSIKRHQATREKPHQDQKTDVCSSQAEIKSEVAGEQEQNARNLFLDLL